MFPSLYLRITAVLFLTVLVMADGNPYFDNEVETDDLDEYDNTLDGRSFQPSEDKRSGGSILYLPVRKTCIGRGGNCDTNKGECCDNSRCRCNLWGSNCKCSTKGLMRKWGK